MISLPKVLRSGRRKPPHSQGIAQVRKIESEILPKSGNE